MSANELLIPTTPEDLTPAWLTAALSASFPGANVASLTSEVLHDGTAFTCRLNVTYTSGSTAGPSTVCIKAGMDAPHRGMVIATGMCCKEAIAYRDLLPMTGARVAKSFATGFDVQSGKAFVLMEDLNAAGSIFCNAEMALRTDQVAFGLEQLAEIHAVYWNDPRIGDSTWHHRGQSLSERDMLMQMFGEPWQKIMKQSHAAAVPALLRRADLLGSAVARLRMLDDETAVSLVHGDAHIGNFFLDAQKRPCMTDFQGIRRGHYTLDLAMFIASACDVMDRRQHERELIRSYLDALETRVEQIPTFEEAWLGYRRHVTYGMWVWLLTSNIYHSDWRLVSTTYRYGMAVLDLNSFEAIGA